jgi:hypothetical protein
MSLSDLAAVAGVLSSLAVFGSLIYLALQVRQADRNQRTLLQQATSARNMESLWKFSDPHYAGIIARVWKGESDFSPAESTQLVYLLRASLFGLQDQYMLKKLALVDPLQTESLERGYQRLMSTPAFRVLWTRSRATYSAEFAAYVDALVEGAPLGAPIDFAAQIKTGVAQLKAAGATGEQSH